MAHYRIYMLGGIVFALILLNWHSPAVVETVNVTARSALLSTMGSTDIASSRSSQMLSSSPLPEHLNRPQLESARNDPFVLPAPPTPVIAKVAPPPVQVPPPTPQPTAPPLNLRYTGRMTAPDGKQVVYVAYGETNLAIATGQSLPNGYRVDAITSRAVEFVYPPLNTTARLELPELPKYEIR